MWTPVVLMLFVTSVYNGHGSHDSLVYYYEEDDGEDNSDFEESYDDSAVTMPVLTTAGLDAHTRVRRFEIGEKRTLNTKEIKDIKDVLQDILSNRNVVTWGPEYKYKVDKSKEQYVDESFVNNLTTNSENVENRKHTPNSESVNHEVNSWAPDDVKMVKEYLYSDPTFEPDSKLEKLRKIVAGNKVFTKPRHVTVQSYVSTEYVSTDVDLRTLDAQEIHKVKEALQNIYINKETGSTTAYSPTENKFVEYFKSVHKTASELPSTNHTETLFEYDSTSASTDVSIYTGLDSSFWALTNIISPYKLPALRRKTDIAMTSTTDSATNTDTTANETLAPVTTSEPTIRLDVQGLLDLIANLTYDYDMNLTQRFNETLMKYSLPTCPTPTTTVTPTTTQPDINFANTSIVAKCFVCGLDKVEIPQDSYCADAFAGEFIPLVPVNPRARGQIASYRKYCRYMDIRGYMDNPEEPRAMYGRFTGGCSVRWVDLSGVYTQRTCRNRRRAVMGKHFTSKRMAKLEMALNDVDEGCIISPMATLVPLSRGISLYARFHACVCTGAWCNRTVHNDPWILNNLILFWYFKFK